MYAFYYQLSHSSDFVLFSDHDPVSWLLDMEGSTVIHLSKITMWVVVSLLKNINVRTVCFFSE